MNAESLAATPDTNLHATLGLELRESVPAPVAALARKLAQRANGAAIAVLFYGSALRDATLDGLLDFYVLLDDVGRWPGSRVAAAANRLLPPNVGYVEDTIDGVAVRAKVAVMSGAQFESGVSREALDTTLWARFSQPCACAWVRSEEDRARVVAAVCRAVVTASEWAAGLGPERGAAVDFWRALFAQTYGAELRVERATRGGDIVSRDADRYARLLPGAWAAAGIAFDETGGVLAPRWSAGDREAARRRWSTRRRLGKPLNLLRLGKAAFTFDGAMDYVAWKVERHSGVKVEVTDWQRRHPLLAAPGLYFRLRKAGAIR